MVEIVNRELVENNKELYDVFSTVIYDILPKYKFKKITLIKFVKDFLDNIKLIIAIDLDNKVEIEIKIESPVGLNANMLYHYFESVKSKLEKTKKIIEKIKTIELNDFEKLTVIITPYNYEFKGELKLENYTKLHKILVKNVYGFYLDLNVI